MFMFDLYFYFLLNRRPLHHSSIPTYTSDGGTLHHAVDAQDSATLNRVRYYQRLQQEPVVRLMSVSEIMHLRMSTMRKLSITQKN